MLCAYVPAHAQQEYGQCATDEHFRDQLAADPDMLGRVLKDMDKIRVMVQKIQSQRTSSNDSTRYIPVVVHVMHDDGAERIGLAQIQSGIDKMNLDFRKLNKDTTQTLPLFKPFATDCKVEFRLAKIDPDGNCTSGVTYWRTPLTYNCRDTLKSVIQWPPDKYFNIWIVNSIDPTRWNLPGGGVIAGYEEFPWAYGISDTYGAVVRHNYWGTNGTAVSNNGRTETHELGHCLGLWHPWQDQLVNGAGDGCSFNIGHDCTDHDDMVCDTPPMLEPTYGCDKTENTCGNDTIGPSPFATDTVDPLDNFMSYSDCPTMFSIGQKERMDAVFATYPALQNLTSPANAAATGTDSGYVAPLCAPVADLYTSKRYICAGASVKYNDYSYGGTPDSWTWSCPGGTPAASTDRSPTITYDSAGVYDVQLIAGNSAGSDTVVFKNYMTVFPTLADMQDSIYTETFEDTASVNGMWLNPVTAGGNQWELTDMAGASGSHSFMVNNYERIWSGESLELITPSYDMSTVPNAQLYFKVAYAAIDNLSGDELKIFVSTNCGNIWALRKSLSGATLKTVADQTTPFVPSSMSEWKTDSIPLTGSYGTGTNVRFKFVFKSWRGNHIYLDDIQVRDKTTGTDELSPFSMSPVLFPNPANATVHLSFSLAHNASSVRARLVDLLGRTLQLTDVGSLGQGAHVLEVLKGNEPKAGLCFVQLEVDGFVWNQKVMFMNE